MSHDKLNELNMINKSLQKDILVKDREIRRLIKDAQQLEKEVSLNKYHTPEASKHDAEVTADICCPGMQIGDVLPVKDYSKLIRKEMFQYRERLHLMEDSVKSSSEKVRELRMSNVSLGIEVRTRRQMCEALVEQCRVNAERTRLYEEVLLEMTRQLKQAKTKLREATTGQKVCKDTSSNLDISHHSDYGSAGSCVRQQPRRTHRVPPPLNLESCECGMSVFGGTDGEASRRPE